MLIAVLTVERPSANEVPSLATLGVACAFTTTSLAAAGFQWVTLLDAQGAQRRTAFRGVFVSQLSKYLPAGGVFQVATQLSLSDSGTPASRLGLFVTGMVQLCAACPVVGLLLILPSSATVPRTIAILATPLVLLAHPTVMSWGLDTASRFIRSFSNLAAPIPKGRLARGQLMALVNIALLSLGFATISLSVDQSVSFLAATGAFALAWLAGFVVVPLPAGLGVREAALVALLPDLSPANVVLAGVILRLVGLVSEVGLAGTTVALRSRS
jgi:uncharacterized membrane protein YbhN (UPF0104 family)